MAGVTVVNHPLVQHKLTLIRDKMLSTKSFRELLSEIGMLLCYEVTRDLPIMTVAIETPLARMQSSKIAGKKLVFAPILRAGVTFIEGMLELVPAARVAHIGLYREPKTFAAIEYFFKAPSNLAETARHRRGGGPRHRQHRCGRRRPPEGTRRQRYSSGLHGRLRRRALIICVGFIPTFQSGRRQSTKVSMSKALSFQGLATPATVPTVRSERPFTVEG